ncbi:MAG: hypothetical protein DRN04_02585 [Thermoprotei archaeon]|nr:MAG: hypothetical protein DRN04_02585 [Thermoprotei archaeon]
MEKMYKISPLRHALKRSWKRVEKAYEGVISSSDEDKPYAIIDFIEYISEYAEILAKLITAKKGEDPEEYEKYLSSLHDPEYKKILALAKIRKVLYRGYKVSEGGVLIERDNSISDLALSIKEDKYIITSSEVTIFYKMLLDIKNKIYK